MKNYKSLDEFAFDYSTDDQCRQYLYELKWSRGFTCRKCGHHIAVKGRTWYYKKCQKCKHDESCTANTLFHKVKFPLDKAFWITYQLSILRDEISTMEICRRFDIHQETAWFFKRKVQLSIQRCYDNTFSSIVMIGETDLDNFERVKTVHESMELSS